MAVNPDDDPSISDECRLLRRIRSQPGFFIVWNSNENAWTISSQAFKGHPQDKRTFSVYLEDVLQEHGLGPDAVILDPEKYSIAAITARLVRELNQVIQRAPEPDDLAHAHVIGDKPSSLQKRLAREAEWVIPPHAAAAPP